MVLSFLKPCYELSLPAYFLVGLGAPLLWSGSSVYISRCAMLRSQALHEPVEASTGFLNGYFFSLFHMNGFIGLILSAVILSFTGKDSNNILFIVLSVIGSIGAFIITFTPSLETTEAAAPLLQINGETTQGITTNATEISIPNPPEVPEKPTESASILHTLKLSFSDLRLTLFIPAIFYNGVSLAFLLGDVSKFVATRTLGLNVTGYVLATYYLLNTLLTYLMGKIAAKPSVRKYSLLFACFAHFCFLALLQWGSFTRHFEYHGDEETKYGTPSTGEYIRVFLVAVLFSLGDNIFQSSVPALLQALFKSKAEDSDAAMAAVKLFQSLGMALQFVLGVVANEGMGLRLGILVSLLSITTVSTFAASQRYLSASTHEKLIDEPA